MKPPADRPGAVAAFLRGDRETLASVEEAVRRVVRSFQFGGADLDRDLVQETLTRLLLGLGSGRFRGEASLETYARTVARYTCLEHIRRRRWEVEIDPEAIPSADLSSAPQDAFLWSEEHLKNLELFASLPAETREILRLVVIDGLSYREAGLRLGISEAAVRSRIHRSRQACRVAAGRGRARRRGEIA